MPEYIERAKAAEFFEKNKQVMWHKDDVAAAVSSKNIPAADVVEVVRCRECEHYNSEKKRCDHPRLEWDVECYDLWLDVELDDFCSYGERKESVNNG